MKTSRAMGSRQIGALAAFKTAEFPISFEAFHATMKKSGSKYQPNDTRDLLLSLGPSGRNLITLGFDDANNIKEITGLA